jgi:beta-lactamase superfamily II metal-dependent hydrolase
LTLAAVAGAQPDSGRLRAYFIDVEGGQATLVVAPSGESLLIDAGWEDERDAIRIEQAAKTAGVRRIDALLVSHYHRDHAGGVAGLARRLPVVNLYDHGENTENYKGASEVLAANRAALANSKRHIVKPGDKIPIAGLDVVVITSAGKRIEAPLKGAGEQNAACGNEKPQKDEKSENAASVGILIQFGKFRMLDLTDVLFNQELDLMCPVNRIGTADLFVVLHHGKDTSNSATLLRAVRPKVAIMNNGETKGGSPAVFDILRASPGFQDLWQLHYSQTAAERNSEERFLSNPQGTCAGFGIEVVAERDGSFVVRNQRNRYEKSYRPANAPAAAPASSPR